MGPVTGNISEYEEDPVLVQGQPFEQVAAHLGVGLIQTAELITGTEVHPGGEHGLLDPACEKPVPGDLVLEETQGSFRLEGVDDLVELGQHEFPVPVFRDVVRVRIFHDPVHQTGVGPAGPGREKENGDIGIRRADRLPEPDPVVQIRTDVGDHRLELVALEVPDPLFAAAGRNDGDIRVLEIFFQQSRHLPAAAHQQHVVMLRDRRSHR